MQNDELLPVTAEDKKRADDWAMMLGRMGGVILDQSQRRGLAAQFAAHRTAHSGEGRKNDKPPSHWAANDKCDRHPQSAEEWDWHADSPGEDSFERSIKRLNFAVDRGDPDAPSQMALVLRVDLSRVLGRLVHYTAHRELLMQKQTDEGRSNGAGEDTIHREREAVLQNKRVNDAIQTALERGELVISPNGYLAALSAPQGESLKLRDQLEAAWDDEERWEGDFVRPSDEQRERMIDAMLAESAPLQGEMERLREALARKIVSRFVWTPEDGDLSRRTGPQQATARAMETAALAAIIETTRLASSMAADTLDKARAGEIDNDLRSIKHILVGRFVDDDHLKGQDHG